jgi:hypothetical protein
VQHFARLGVNRQAALCSPETPKMVRWHGVVAVCVCILCWFTWCCCHVCVYSVLVHMVLLPYVCVFCVSSHGVVAVCVCILC